MNGATGAFPIKKAMSARLEWQITALQAALWLARKTMLRDPSLGYQAFFISFLTVRLADVTTRAELLVLSPL
jgi:hypothetical protein